MPALTALEALIKKAEEVAARGGKPFATNVRPKARPGDHNFIGPVEPIGPNQITPQTRIGPPELTTVPEPHGPNLPFKTNVRLKASPETGTDFTMVNPPSRELTLRDVGSNAARIPSTALTTTNPLITVDRFGRPNTSPRLSDIWDAEFREIPRPSTLGPVSAADELAFRTVRPQTLSREELLAMRGPEQAAMSAGTPSSGSYLPLFAGSVLGGTALLSGGQRAQEQDRDNRFAQIYGTSPQSAGAGRGMVVEQPGARMAEESVGSGRGAPPPSMEAYLKGRNDSAAANAALDVARARVAPARAEQPSSGGLSRLFSDPFAGKSSRDLYGMAQNMGGDEYGANLMNIRAAKAESEGMATGGAAKPHKDAALHKALDIISHMLGRQ